MLTKVLLLFACLAWSSQAESCHCKDPSLCGPVGTNQSGFEFIGFSLSQDPAIYKKYDWTKLTTAVVLNVGNQTKDFACYAHSKNARVTLLVSTSTTVLQNDTLRKKFVNDSVKKVVDYGLDGINVDFEGNVYINTTAYNDLTDLMQELRTALKKVNSVYTLTMDYVYCATCITGRTYNYKAIQKFVDYFIIMDYDMQGTQDTAGGLCNKLVNAPYWTVHNYTVNFITDGIDPRKLVMAFPWYGYNAPCAKFDKAMQTCYTDCGNVGRSAYQYCYSGIIGSSRDDSMDGRQWNPKTLTPFLNFVSQGTLFQINYDDPWSLRYKYQMALYLKVRGVGAWHLNCLNYADDPISESERSLMWSVIPTGK